MRQVPFRLFSRFRKFCPDLLNKVEIYLDGGVSRGTDILKAISLGATACGLGRPFMYAVGVGATEAVCKLIESKFEHPSISVVHLKHAMM